MSEIEIKKPSKEELTAMDILAWPIWEKEISTFDWKYDDKEVCYILEGEVSVKTKDGEEVEFGPGDLVSFPKGLECVWEVKKPVRKHYNFG
jgi:uncharacterized cupin superfamily protein